MELEEIYKKGRSYKENFFYGDMLGDVKLYELQEGTFLLGKTSEETELLWGVNQLDDLRYCIEKIKSENKDTSFIFRYANNLNNVIEKKKIIDQWGYKSKYMNVGYFCSLDNISSDWCDSSIEYLNENEIDKFLKLDREIFTSFNITEEELLDWLKNDDHIILTYKENNKVLGYIMIGLYGANYKNCFIRNLGICASERKKGIGKKLMLYGLNEAKKRGSAEAMLWVGFDNTVARNLYENIGFIMDENEAESVFEVNTSQS